MIRFLAACFLLAACSCGAFAAGTTVKEIARIKGQGESIIRGAGLVTGLPGTGDSGKETAALRPLARTLENSGVTVASAREIQGKSVALVLITCVIPPEGSRADDRFDCTVTVVGNASSLKGGHLFLTPLRGPFPDSPVYAMCEGAVEIPDASVPTTGRVRLGARMIQDILMPEVKQTFELLLHPSFAGWAAASQVATAVNAKAQPQGPAVAIAIDERTVRVEIPDAEMTDRAAFLADVLSAEVNPSLLDLPAQVIVNTRSGSIIVTGDVTIAPVAFTTRDLSITTVRPAPTPTAQAPLVERSRWADLQTGARPSEQTRLTDLLAAFKHLDIPVSEQINLLQMLHKTGKLQARLVID